jgi:hypothetical protein
MRAVSLLLLGLSCSSLLFACGDEPDDPASDDGQEVEDVPEVLTFDPKMVTGESEDDRDDSDEDPGPSQRDSGVVDDGDGDDEQPDDEGETPTYSCAGVSTSCSVLSLGTCSTASGCSWKRECTGIADSCYSQYSSYACTSLDGCYWSSSSDSCSGVSRSCSSQLSSLSCSDQGCNWNESCSGISTSCFSIFSQASCLSQPGCRWERDL